MSKKKVIENSFFDFISFIISLFFSFYRSIKLLFIKKNKGEIKKNKFFNFLDFLFRGWTKYFWKTPSFYKVTSFFGDILNWLFKNKN